MRLLTLLSAALAMIAIAAGCGGGGDDTSGGGSATGASTAAESTGSESESGGATAQADDACADANKEIAALQQPNGDDGVVEYLEATEEAVTKLQVEIAGLESGASELGEYSSALSKSVTVLNEMANAARSRNPDAVRELSQDLVKLHVGKIAEAAGLENCAQGPGVES